MTIPMLAGPIGRMVPHKCATYAPLMRHEAAHFCRMTRHYPNSTSAWPDERK
jgi:hypothetical protein